ncbi:SAV_2336 N-terminal domain-related protein [Nocardiopsis alborubida]|uniref:NACHT domain-containing protein n=1 Tax=Nocardiopsis alborubida TaxID=146802 RepID=A0A7X6MI01_9ACTN|nr:SAV_2336 N-terminal domain-related protein [Nocardiopsis alborubida]NKZ00064.1 NACHT domain-containing protein [Nocardiopsis alborubida]
MHHDRRLYSLLHEAPPSELGGPTPLEIAEVLWLGAHTGRPAVSPTGPEEPVPAPSVRRSPEVTSRARHEEPERPDRTGTSTPASRPNARDLPPVEVGKPPETAGDHDASRAREAPGALPGDDGIADTAERLLALHFPPAPGSGRGFAATSTRVPVPPMIDEPLALQRALRPLNLRVPTATAEVLDEEATAHRIADRRPTDSRPWAPVLVPGQERWLNLLLIVDTGPSMGLWRPLAEELHTLLHGMGVFRDVRVGYLVHGSASSGAELGVAPTPHGPPQDAATAVDPSARRAVLVLSDCSGPHWWSGLAGAVLHLLARHGPTAIVQPLAEAQWRRTGAPVLPSLATSARPGAPNTELRLTLAPGAPGPASDSVPVPVLRCAPRWFGDWAELVGSGNRAVPAAVTYVSGRAPRTAPAPVSYEQPLTVRQRVHRFQGAASPAAVALAAHTALSTPALPVMRMIQHEVLHDADSGVLAEVLLSGLLRPVDHEQGLYAFVEGAAEALRSVLPRSTAQRTARLLDALSDGVRRQAEGNGGRFPAYLVGGGGDRFTGPASAPFAWVNPDTLRLLDPRAARSVAAVEKPPRKAAGHVLVPRLAHGDRQREAPSRSLLTFFLEQTVSEGRGPVVLGEVPPKPRRFIPRPDLRSRLESLEEGRSLVLAGEGGTGKTLLASDHATRAARGGDVDLVLWANGADLEKVLTSYARSVPVLAPALFSPEGDLRTEFRNGPHALTREFCGWLTETSVRWLLVLDGLDHPGDVLGLLPMRSRRGRVLATSRHHDVLGGAVPKHAVVEVGGFAREEAVEYLSQRFFGTPAFSSSAGIGILADYFGHHPLALSLAASTVVTEELAPLEYLRGKGERTAAPVQEAVHLSLVSNSRVPYLSSMPLLLMIRLFGHTDVPLRLLATSTVRRHLDRQLPRTAKETRSVKGIGGILRNLESLSLIRIEDSPDGLDSTVWVHDSVRPPVHDLPVFLTASNTAVAAVESLLEAWQTAGDRPEWNGRLRRSAIALRRSSEEVFPPGRTLPGAISRRREAAHFYARLVRALERILGPDHEETHLARTTERFWW